MVDHAAIDDLVAWMIDGAPPVPRAPLIIDTICRELVEAGVPIDRLALFLYTLSPRSTGRRYLWTPNNGVEMAEGEIGLLSTQDYLANPVPVVVRDRVTIRRRLADPQSPNDFLILDQLRAEGFTDYLAQPLAFATGGTAAMSCSTRAPGGFSADAVAALDRIRRPVARLVEALVMRVNAANLLSAYVGRNGGEQVLSGKVHRGDGEEIQAAILFTDLIGYTELSNRHSGPEMVALLNDAFDQLVPAVEAEGGEILKFLGDGFFAIFPFDDQAGRASAVGKAQSAVLRGEASLAGTEVGQTATFRSAIHAGRFHFGNIGGADRLDFTAIGPAVNYASRLLAAASQLSVARAASEEIAPYLSPAASLAGEVRFKGFEGLQKVCAY